MTHFEQVHGEVGGGVDCALAVTLPEITGALGEEVEGALRLVDLEPGNLAGKADDEVAAALKGLAQGAAMNPMRQPVMA